MALLAALPLPSDPDPLSRYPFRIDRSLSSIFYFSSKLSLLFSSFGPYPSVVQKRDRFVASSSSSSPYIPPAASSPPRPSVDPPPPLAGEDASSQPQGPPTARPVRFIHHLLGDLCRALPFRPGRVEQGGHRGSDVHLPEVSRPVSRSLLPHPSGEEEAPFLSSNQTAERNPPFAGMSSPRSDSPSSTGSGRPTIRGPSRPRRSSTSRARSS